MLVIYLNQIFTMIVVNDFLRCHDIEFGDLDVVISETLPALQRLKQQGLVRFIGITGLPFEAFHYVLDRVPLGGSTEVHLFIFDENFPLVISHACCL